MRSLKVLPKDKALEYLIEANKMNPGLWYEHSLNAGQAAWLIASACDDLNEELAYVLGVLHDIGRREGKSHLKHVTDGYRYMMKEGYSSVARICLTHSFPNPNIDEYLGHKDSSDDDLNFLKQYLDDVVYDDYDRLIQLCDALADTKGFCLVEKRLLETGIRLGATEHTRQKWKSYLDLVAYFSKKAGMSVYKLLPGVVENTFDFNQY
ncbi:MULTISPECIES: HD domain-containing protein [unclassified Fusibacter]|uniref:HD domain-containing protein n=1 Tax=unclassified Fusibacter TaxID=2624464 RepID=UPI0010102723|nr:MULTISPECIES: HD domain-containing protein [unclassified Fusibacter]MCK8060257.1 HDOD domain-containing protein [Fusibacter sp. A2]NPE20455.1 HD domain-containing protein [Fusibacter sp. A1]RXV63660.1 HD domain-containing protein [Fusibacter sp. A1]